jgi:carbon-monoxide dehydrogenase small subunit
VQQTIRKIPVTFKLNGENVEILIKPWQTLLEVLRDELQMTGTKEGCSNGNCGACTVIVDGQAIDSCLAFGAEADGHEITTIEGLAQGNELHPVQRAFIDHAALQCGFCTPGFIMSAKAFLDKNPNPTELELRTGIAGNLCRCTGYDKIIKAIMSVPQR